jgi:hypothetical protein
VPVEVLTGEEHDLVPQQQLVDEVAELRVGRVEAVVVDDEPEVRPQFGACHGISPLSWSSSWS